MRCEKHCGAALVTCLQEGVCLAWNDVGVRDTGQPLEAVALFIFACHLDEEALEGGAELRETPQSLLAEVRGQRHRDGA